MGANYGGACFMAMEEQRRRQEEARRHVDRGYDCVLATTRPPQPAFGNGSDVWYRGWECGWNDMADRYGSEGWEAYKGGCDLDARRVASKTWDGLLDEIDAEEDE